MKKNNNKLRSLMVDEVTWNSAMKYAKANYNTSLSKVINSLLEDWVNLEMKKGLVNPNQRKLL